MRFVVCTTYNDLLHKLYAHRFMDTYNWPFEVIIYNEDVDFFDRVPELKKFVDRNSHRLTFMYGSKWRYDAVRFSYKVYAYTNAVMTAEQETDGIMFIDADCVFNQNAVMTVGWIEENVHRENCMVSYMPRNYVTDGWNQRQTETGFIYFNMRHPYVRSFTATVKAVYDEDTVYNLGEYHDAYVFDDILNDYVMRYDVSTYSLIPDGAVEQGGVLELTPLSDFVCHRMGRVKHNLFEYQKVLR